MISLRDLKLIFEGWLALLVCSSPFLCHAVLVVIGFLGFERMCPLQYWYLHGKIELYTRSMIGWRWTER